MWFPISNLLLVDLMILVACGLRHYILYRFDVGIKGFMIFAGARAIKIATGAPMAVEIAMTIASGSNLDATY